jgi:3-methyl-2-oxobutanoate hydroxymethyltransferase
MTYTEDSLVEKPAIRLFADFTPKFAKRFTDVGLAVSAAAADYAKEVRANEFPRPEHCFGVRK